MLLQRSTNTLRISTVALFCAFFSVGLMLSPLSGSSPHEARPQQLSESSSDLTHSGICAQLPHLPRQGNPSESILSIPSLSLARPPRRGGGYKSRPPSRSRIVNEPEATLLQHKHAPDPSASCRISDNRFMIPRTEWRRDVPLCCVQVHRQLSTEHSPLSTDH
jgi:hypothetical protein